MNYQFNGQAFFNFSKIQNKMDPTLLHTVTLQLPPNLSKHENIL